MFEKGGENPIRKEEEEIKRDDLKTPIAASKPNQEPKKEEEEDDDDDKCLLSLAKAKKKKTVSASKAKKEDIDSEEDVKAKKTQKVTKSNVKLSSSKVKKEESEYMEDDMDNKKKVQKKKVVGKKIVKKVKTVVDTKRSQKERKVYDLPGQKHEPPPERDPLRIFYESLYQQVPTSEMAAFWMLEWGLLSASEAKKVYDRKVKRNQQQKLWSPAKKVVSAKKTVEVSVNTVKKTTSNSQVKNSKKRKGDDSEADDDDDDFIVSRLKSKKHKASA